MKMNEADLKRFFREYIASKIPNSRRDCLPMKVLVDFFSARTSKRSKKKVLDHIAKCDLCTQEFEFIMGVRRYEETIADHVRQVCLSEQKRHSERRIFFLVQRQAVRTLLLFLAGILTLFALNIFLQNIGDFPERGKSDSSIVLLQPTQIVHTTPLIFRWNKVEEADYYVLELFNEALSPLWKSGHLSAPEIAIPQAIAVQLKQNTYYFWMITFYTKGGTKSESPMEYFIITE